MTDAEFSAFVAAQIGAEPKALPHFSAARCPDQIIGYAKYTTDAPPGVRLWLPKAQRKLHAAYLEQFEAIRQSLVLVIESPHKDEYADPDFVAPALGKTGEYLQAHLPALLASLQAQIAPGKYTIVLANTVQRQCSLGEPPQKYRDALWRALWEREEAAFLERIASYRPQCLFEMCTASDGRKQKVRRALAARFAALPLFSTPHPCSWWQPGNRRLQRLPQA